MWLPENSITDISALASCKRLRYLDVGVNQITDISVLAHFRKLWGGSLAVNEITDISVLESCPRLKIVEVFDNPLSGEAAAVIAKLRVEEYVFTVEGRPLHCVRSSPATHDVPI